MAGKAYLARRIFEYVKKILQEKEEGFLILYALILIVFLGTALSIKISAELWHHRQVALIKADIIVESLIYSGLMSSRSFYCSDGEYSSPSLSGADLANTVEDHHRFEISYDEGDERLDMNVKVECYRTGYEREHAFYLQIE